MTYSKVIALRQRALRLYSGSSTLMIGLTSVMLIFQGPPLFFMDSRIELKDKLLRQSAIFAIHVITSYLSSALATRQVFFSSKTTAMLGYGILSACWIPLSIIQQTLDNNPPSSEDDILSTNNPEQTLEKGDYSDDKQIQLGNISTLRVVWLLTLLLISIAMGIITAISTAVWKMTCQEYETAKANEEDIERVDSAVSLPPQPKGLSQRANHNEEPIHETHKSEKSEMSKQGDRPTANSDILLALSRKNAALSAVSLMVGLINFWSLFWSRSSSSTMITRLCSLSGLSFGTLVFAPDFLESGLIMGTIMILVTSRLIPAN